MRAEDWKNFNGGGFKLFKEGHVQNIMINQQGAVFGVKCRCLPEMKKDKFYNINLNISMDNSSVTQAECSCLAGKGPHGSCKHIAAVLITFMLAMRKLRRRMKLLVRLSYKLGTSQEKDVWTQRLLMKYLLRLNPTFIPQVINLKNFLIHALLHSRKPLQMSYKHCQRV